MNIEYVANKDEAIVSNEKGELKIKDYTSNFDETRKKENEVEIIQNRFRFINNEISQCQTKMAEKKKNIKKGLLAVVGTMVGVNVLFYYAADIYVMENIIIATLFGGGFVSLYPLLMFLNYKTLQNKLDAMNFQKYFLDKKLYQSQSELQALYLNGKMIMIEEKKKIKIEDREGMQKLKEYFQKLQQYGNNISKEAYYYARGSWETKEQEKIASDGLDTELFASYLNEYNTRKLMKRKKVS